MRATAISDHKIRRGIGYGVTHILRAGQHVAPVLASLNPELPAAAGLCPMTHLPRIPERRINTRTVGWFHPLEGDYRPHQMPIGVITRRRLITNELVRIPTAHTQPR